jgi:hypothetical protein
MENFKLSHVSYLKFNHLIARKGKKTNGKDSQRAWIIAVKRKGNENKNLHSKRIKSKSKQNFTLR